MNEALSVNLLRAAFIALTCLLGILFALALERAPWAGALIGTSFGLIMVAVDALLRGITVRSFSHGTFGLLVGILCAWLLTRIGLLELTYLLKIEDEEVWRQLVQIALYLALGFLGASLALRSGREDFAFIIPYVRFREEASRSHPILVDTNVIIDGRVPRLYQSGFLLGPFIVPQFVLDELQRMADSSEPTRADRGRRGLECLEQMREAKGMETSIYNGYSGEKDSVDAQLIHLAAQVGGRILTNDQNLKKVAEIRGVKVLSLNELSQALRPTVSPGDELFIQLVKQGKDEHQAVGYLHDGTMVVVNRAIDFLGQEVPVTISGSLPTSAGRLVFADLRLAPAGMEDPAP